MRHRFARVEPSEVDRETSGVAVSFEEAFATEFRPLFRYLARRVGASEAEELAASTFATALASWDTLDPDRPVRPWLYGIASNLLRHHWRREERMLRAYARSGVDLVQGDGEVVVEPVDASMRYRHVARALADLRPRDRELLLLQFWADLSNDEIAAALGMPVGTVKSRLHRTLVRLRNQLAPNGQEQANRLLPVREEQP